MLAFVQPHRTCRDLEFTHLQLSAGSEVIYYMNFRSDWPEIQRTNAATSGLITWVRRCMCKHLLSVRSVNRERRVVFATGWKCHCKENARRRVKISQERGERDGVRRCDEGGSLKLSRGFTSVRVAADQPAPAPFLWNNSFFEQLGSYSLGQKEYNLI